MCICSVKCCCHYTIFRVIKFRWGQLGTTKVESEQQISKFDPSFLGCRTPCPSVHMANSPLASELDLSPKKWVTGKNSLVNLCNNANNFFSCRKCGPLSRRAGQHLPPFTSLYFLTSTLLEMVEWRRKENQGLTGIGCCQKTRLYWNRCFQNLRKPAERCQNVHNMNQQFTDILCEFGLVAGKVQKEPSVESICRRNTQPA